MQKPNRVAQTYFCMVYLIVIVPTPFTKNSKNVEAHKEQFFYSNLPNIKTDKVLKKKITEIQI